MILNTQQAAAAAAAATSETTTNIPLSYLQQAVAPTTSDALRATCYVQQMRSSVNHYALELQLKLPVACNQLQVACCKLPLLLLLGISHLGQRNYELQSEECIGPWPAMAMLMSSKKAKLLKGNKNKEGGVGFL